MRIFVSGGTGVLGRRVVPLLTGAGYSVSALSRSPASSRAIEAMGATAVPADLFEPETLESALAAHDTLINIATHIPPISRAARASAWHENDRIRTEGVSNLIAAADHSGIKRFIQESIVFPYDDGAGAWIDEAGGQTPNELTAAALHAERSATDFDGGGRVGLVLRFGQFYAIDSSHTRSHAGLCRWGINPFFGPAEHYLPLVGIDAAARAVVAAVTLPGGIYNAVDDDPPTRGEAGAAVAKTIGRGKLRAIPAGLIGFLSPASRLLMRSQRVTNRKLAEASGWKPDHGGATGIARTVQRILAPDAAG